MFAFALSGFKNGLQPNRFHAHLSKLSLLGCSMQTQTARFAATVVNFDSGSISRCGSVIRNGGLVAFPTETVYGLGANALNADAVRSIFEAKKRPFTDPVIVHVLAQKDIFDLFDFSYLGSSQLDLKITDPDSINSESFVRGKAQLVCEALCSAFWPGTPQCSCPSLLVLLFRSPLVLLSLISPAL